MQLSRGDRNGLRGFSLVEAILSVAILAAAMLAASQGVMATTNGKLAVQRGREIRQWHADRILHFQHGTRLAEATPGTLPAVTETTSDGHSVTVIETLTMPNPALAVLVSQATWTAPGAGSISETLTGVQSRP